MPFPAGLARFNRAVTNKITRPLARLLPGFGVIRHEGRKTGEAYHTPVNVWDDRDRLVVALVYGPDVDWLRNAETSDSVEIVVRGHVVKVGRPVHISRREGMDAVPAPVRLALDAAGVSRFVAFPRLR